MRYFIQYAAGTGDLILQAIPSYVDTPQVRYRDDSAMIFDSASAASRVGSIPFAKNVFVVIANTPRGSIDKGVNQLGRLLANARFPNSLARGKGFRIMVHIDGGLSPIDQRSKISLEQAIAARTGQRVEPRGMCQEYWVIGRQDLDELLLCVRLPKEKRPPKAKGAISYELSSMLVAASQPSPQDVYLDPFAGSGSFVLARLDKPARQIWYSDRELRRFERDFPQELMSDKRVRFLDDDALSLRSIPDGTIDVVVTDPPWGEHEDVGLPYAEFVRALVNSFDRILRRPAGRFVMLTSRRTAALMDRELSEAFSVDSRHEILVNGHPVTVLIGTRSAADRA